MRTPEEMLALVTEVAARDERIRAVLLGGSRTDPDGRPDPYQDFDVVYFVRDVAPFWDNEAWIEEQFGKPALLQKPESMRLIPPDGDGNYAYLMLFPDGNRIDLQITSDPYEDDGEPVKVLLDKDGRLNDLQPDRLYWHVKKPDQKLFADCCNEFYWCLQNVAKGLARDEVSYAMHMREDPVRNMLIQMLSWGIAADSQESVAVGKLGKYFKSRLSPEDYQAFLQTYSDADPEHAWEALFTMHALFAKQARKVAGAYSFTYRESEEQAILKYAKMLRERSSRDPGHVSDVSEQNKED